MTEYNLHMNCGDSTTIHADSDAEALHAAEEVASETGSVCVEVYRVRTFDEGYFGSMDTLQYVGSRP